MHSGLNQNIAITANQLNLSLNTNACLLLNPTRVCLFLNPTHNGAILIFNDINDTDFRVRRYYGGSQAMNVTTIQNSDNRLLV